MFTKFSSHSLAFLDFAASGFGTRRDISDARSDRYYTPETILLGTEVLNSPMKLFA